MNNTGNLNLIIFGATGDLAKKRLFPSLYSLYLKGRLNNFSIIGTALDNMETREFIQTIKEYINTNIDPDLWSQFSKRIAYINIDLTKKKEFEKLKDLIEKQGQTKSNRLIYLSVSPTFFKQVTENLLKNNIIERLNSNDNWHRIAYEKPFGTDLKSAKKINKYITQNLSNDQIYRIDHFLADCMVKNIPILRFFNKILNFNEKNIKQINITLIDNSKDIENRGSFYETVGVLLDVVQNHMLQLLTIMCMKKPNKIDYNSFSSEKVKVLKKTEFVDGILGQYNGYRNEKGVSSNSKVETFASLIFKINNKKMKKVPIFLKAGKCLDQLDISSEYIFENNSTKNTHNKLKFNIEVNPSINIQLCIENPKNKIDESLIIFDYIKAFKEFPTANELIFEDILNGNEAISVQFEEIKYAWKIIDKIKQSNLPLYFYNKGTKGPLEENQLKAKYNIE